MGGGYQQLDAKEIIKRLIWIDAKVNNQENTKYQKKLKKDYNLTIEAYETAEKGIKALEGIQFESIFVITSGTIYPEFFKYMKRTFEELRVIPFSIIFTSSKNNFIQNHKNDEIGKLYNKTFFNRGGVVDRFDGVISFINEIYTNLNEFHPENKYKGIFTKNYSGSIVFKDVTNNLSLPDFYKDIYNHKHIDFSELNDFTKFFLKNFCTSKIEKLLKPLILFKEVPEVIISKYWARIYTYESPFYSVMNRTLMSGLYKEYEVYIKLLYRGLECNSFRPKFVNTLTRGTKLEQSEIDYLKSIAGKNKIIINKGFLSFSLNMELSIKFQENTERDDGGNKEVVKVEQSQKKLLKNTLSVLIKLQNINENEKNDYVISNAFLKDISYYSKEEEVLIFPFTGFEVTDWEMETFEKKDYFEEETVFYFKLSKNYLQKINKKYQG